MSGTEREIGALTLPLHIDLIPYSCLCLALTQKTNLPTLWDISGITGGYTFIDMYLF